jgi:predicted acyltransferase
MMITMQGNPSSSSSSSSPPHPRVLSIDILRGITIAFMILVNDPGDWAHVYAQLNHANWNGWTLTDLVFPTFLFLVGASTILSLRARIARGASRSRLALHIIRRSAILFVIDLFLASFPYFHFTHMRIYGVLTRIAICYLCAGLIYLLTQRASTLATICAACLIGYWALLRFVPVPGFGTPTHEIPLLDQVGNLTSWIDRGFTDLLQRTIHTGRLYRPASDPEGLLSTIPAVATTLLGSLTAIWMQRANSQSGSSRISKMQCCIGFFTAGTLSAIVGLVWNHTFPINKNLWTSSFVLYTAGCALLGLAFCYWLTDIRRLHETTVGNWLVWPWLVFGSNAIVAFVVSELTVEILLWIKINDNGRSITALLWLYRHLFARQHSTNLTSLAFAIAFVLFCFIPNWLLWRKRLFLRI